MPILRKKVNLVPIIFHQLTAVKIKKKSVSVMSPLSSHNSMLDQCNFLSEQ